MYTSYDDTYTPNKLEKDDSNIVFTYTVRAALTQGRGRVGFNFFYYYFYVLSDLKKKKNCKIV